MSLAHGSLGATLFSLALAALAAFNVYVIEKVAQLTSEEEFLKAEVRKAELRKELASFGAFATDANTVTSGPPAPERVDG
jgi:hypothetical protein